MIATKFNYDKTLQAIQEYMGWRKITFPIQITDKMQEYLNSGIVYVHGRDHRYRPIIIMNMYLLDTKKVTPIS